MLMDSDDSAMLSCAFCNRGTISLKQYRVIRSLVALSFAAVHTSVVYQSCPECMRAFVWKRCLVNGLTTWLVGYIILVPYTLALTLATLRRGHSWPVLHGVTPEMHLNRTWVNEPTAAEKAFAIMAIGMCLVPGIGVLYCWWTLGRTHWCTGWVHRTAEIAALVAYFVSCISISLWFKL
jgi:hypothetical protein